MYSYRIFKYTIDIPIKGLRINILHIYAIFSDECGFQYALPHEVLKTRMSSTDNLKRVLTDHLVRGTFYSRSLKSDTMLGTAMMDHGMVKIYMEGN